MSILAVLVVIGVIFLLSFLVESLVEYLFAPLFNNVPALAKWKWLQMYAALIVGVAGAFLYGFDLLFLLGNYLAGQFSVEVPPMFVASFWLGKALTGIAIGRGSAYLHDLVSKYFVKPKDPGAVG